MQFFNDFNKKSEKTAQEIYNLNHNNNYFIDLMQTNC